MRTRSEGHHDRWLARLSDYVDGECSRRARRAVEAHLAGCGPCADAADELRRLKEEAPRLAVESDPAADLWPAVAARLRDRPRRLRLTWPVVLWTARPRFALALGAATVLTLAVALWVAQMPGRLAPAPVPRASVDAPDEPIPVESDARYLETVAALEREAKVRLARDPRLVDILEENLASLDVAIATYREVLARAPDDAGMRQRLTSAREHKLEVLQQAVTLAEGAN
jgi:anti-sigma factor RsiW